MSNAWFRLYSEFAFDLKIQMLSEIDQRRFVMLLCLRSCNDNVTLHETEITFSLRISNEEWQKTKTIFIEKNLIFEDGNGIKITNWDKRQFVSDSSTARVAKHREKKRIVTKCNVTVTPPEYRIQNTDIKKKNTKKKKTNEDEFERFWSLYPKKTGKANALKAWLKVNPDEQLVADILSGLGRAMTLDTRFREAQFTPYPASWLNARGWEDEHEPLRNRPALTGYATAQKIDYLPESRRRVVG